MKRFAIALAMLAASIVSAHASDLKDPFAAPTSYEAPTYAFTGFGLGVDVGGQFGSTQLNGEIEDGEDSIPFEFDGIAHDGLIGGAHLEYLFAVDRARFGGYCEGGFSNADTTLEFGPDAAEVQQDSYYGCGLKAGVTVYGDTLLFARAGYDWSQWTASANFAEDDIDADVGSWLIGGGVDAMVSQNWSLGLGVDYLLVNDVDAAGQDLSDLFEESEIIRAKARLTRRF